MNAPVSVDSTTESSAWIFDFLDPPTLDEHGRAGYWQVLGLQAHVLVTRLMAENRRLRTERMPYCDVCGSRPCRNPSFCSTCQAADRKAQRHKPRHAPRPTPQSTIEAILYCVRARGPKALREPANVERLSRCDAVAKAEIDRRITKLIAAKEITP
jgi:hypothetical protein